MSDSQSPPPHMATAGNQQTNTVSAGKVNACSVATASDLNNAMGMQFKEGRVTADQGDLTRCTFDRADGAGSVNVEVHMSDVSGMYKSMPGMTSMMGNGIGDQAWWSPQVSNFVCTKGSHTMVIAFNYQGATQKQAEDLARAIVPKL